LDMDKLNETAVLAALRTNWLGRPCYYQPVVGSTNDLLKKVVAEGTADPLPAGTLWLTDHQSQGRGRLQRRWQAPAGTSLLFSLLFRPHWPAEQANWLTMMTALAAAEAVEAATGLVVGLKWPNDIMLADKGHWYKLGGILLEGDIVENGRLDRAVVGVGLNVNIAADQLPPAITPATSLLRVLGRPLERLPLLVDLLGRLEQFYETAAAGQSPQPTWNKRLLTVGQPVRVTYDTSKTAQVIEGLAEATDSWGHLLVRDGRGKLHTISAGDVTLR
jgi:BirA family transcriptional regulator, biotin operon repressor / biotin---[acetyl-CoA-carboxylase] ligase